MTKKKSRSKFKTTRKRQHTTKKHAPAKQKPVTKKPVRKKTKPTPKKRSVRTAAVYIKIKAFSPRATAVRRHGSSRAVSQAVLKGFMDGVRKHLSRHCVLLSYAPKGTSGFTGWKFTTGILVNLEGRKLIVTAGHWAEEAQSLSEAQTLESIFVSYAHVSNDLTTKLIPPEAISPSMLRIADGFDSAFLVPSEEITADIEAQGNRFFRRNQFMHGTTKSTHLFIVCGYPVQANIIANSLAFYTRSGGTTFRHDKISLAGVAFQSTLLRPKNDENSIIGPGFNCDANQFAFRPTLGRINSRPESGITSAKGMSGGPVVAVVAKPKDNMTFFKPKLLGMQFQEKSINRSGGIEITQLDAVSAPLLLTWIDAELALI